METYSLWNGEVDGDGAVSLYVTAINVQEIGSGTEEFASTVLSDFGLPDTASDWSVSAPFATNYLSRDDDTDEWRDRWWNTWDVRFTLATSKEVELHDRVVDTFAFDESWTGEESTPEAFVVVAALPDQKKAQEVKDILSRLLDSDEDAADSDVEPLTEAVVAQVEETFGSKAAPRARVSLGRSPGLIEVRVEHGQRKIEDTVTAADLVEQLASSCGARTRWHPSE